MAWRSLARIQPVLISAILLAGVLVGLARLLLPTAASLWQNELQQAIGQALPEPLTIGEVHARWRGFGPQLVLRQIDLRADDGQQLRLAELQLDLAPLDSLWQRRPVIRQAALVGADLLLRRKPDGRFSLFAGTAAASSEMDAGLDLAQLPLGIGLVNSRIRILTRSDQPPLQLDQVNLRLIRQSQGFSARGQLQLAGSAENRLSFAADIRGALEQPDLWSGQLGLQIEGLDLQQGLANLLPTDWPQVQGKLGLHLSADLQQGQLHRLSGELQLADLLLVRQLRQRLSGYNLDQLQGRFHWQRQAQNWQLQVIDLQVTRNRMQWPASALSLRGLPNGRVDVAVDFLRLEDILGVVMLLPENRGEQLLTGLQRVQPHGDLRDLRLHMQDNRWHLQGSADKVRTFAWQQVPAIDSLSGSFQVDQDGGIARIDNRDVQFAFANDLFPGPMRFPRLQGEVHWLRHSTGWQIASRNIQLSTPDFKTGTAFSLSIPDRGRAHLDLRSAIEQGDVAYVRDYLPVGIMNPKMVRWLERALVSGRILRGQALFHGALADFPFDQGEPGHFDARLDVEGVILDYQPGWPRLEQASVALHFANNSLSAHVSGGEIAASRVVAAEARIHSLFPVSPLQMTAGIEGPLSDELRILTDTPLAERLGPLTSGVEVTGDARLELNLQVPLSQDDDRDMQVSGQLELLDNSIAKSDWSLALASVRGKLGFSEQGLKADDLKAMLLGSEISISIDRPAQGQPTEVRASGPFDIQTLAQHRLGLALPLTQGRSHWQLKVAVPDRDSEQPVQLQLSSDLRGVSIDLPAPLGKPEKARKPVRVELEPDKMPVPLHLRWGDQLDARLLLERVDGELRLQQGNIRLGGTPADPADRAGLWIRGQLSYLSLDPLLELTGMAGSGQPLLPHVDVELGQLHLFGFTLDAIQINGGPEQGDWAARLDSPTLSGTLRLPARLRQEAIRLDLEQLALSLTPDRQPSPQRAPSQTDPRAFPNLHLSSQRLLLNGENLGSLDLKTLRNDQGIDFSQLRVHSDWFKLNLRGQWLKEKRGPVCSSMFKLETSDMGRLQKVLNGSADLHKASGRLEGNLAWPGSPLDFGNLDLRGELDLHLDKGSILDLEPGAGRVFGLLNLGALQRRLSLDFSDLLNKGFAFDRIQGRFQLYNGVADTNNLSIEAPSGVVNLYGRTDLINKHLDQMIEVIPDITGTLATAGTLVGGPLVGAALFLANKVVGKELNKISRIRYLLNGPWDNPTITRYGQAAAKGQPGVEDKRAEDPFDLH